jgi:hypothetical protein
MGLDRIFNIFKSKPEDIMAGEDKVLSSLERQAQRFKDEDRKRYLRSYIARRNNKRDAQVFTDKGILSVKKSSRSKISMIGQDGSFFRKGGFL